MRVDVRYAALDDQAEQRVRIAARLLAAHGREARVAAWDGTRCDAVVVAFDDGYGQRVLEIARRRGVAVVAADGCAAHLAAALQQALVAARGAETPADRVDDGVAARTGRESPCGAAGLVLLAGDAYRGADVSAVVGGRAIVLNGAAGRVAGDSLSDLLAARDHLGDAAWQLRALPPGRRGATSDAAMSLDAFFVVGALRAKRTLPAFAAGTYVLRDWPDLGTAPEALAGLRVAQRLMRAPSAAPALAAAGIAGDEVNACLWAFRASNLLIDAEPAPAPPAANAEPAARPLLARIAARFGLLAR